MAERDHKNQPADDLDRMLDAELAKYAVVEPRAGLEERILAHLHAQPATEARPWWRWGFALALAVALIAAGLAWRSSKSRPVIVQQPSGTVPAKDSMAVQNAGANAEPAQIQKQPKLQAVVHEGNRAIEKLAVTPKREQFPSPQPLSDQEKLLASYVAEYPERAAFIARERAELAQREHEEEMREMNGMAIEDLKQIQQ